MCTSAVLEEPSTTTDIDVVNFRIYERDEEIRLSEENYCEFITACTGGKRDLDVDQGESVAYPKVLLVLLSRTKHFQK